MSRLPGISAFDGNTAGWGFFLCTDKSARTGRTGEPFLALTLADATGEVPGRLFDNVDRFADQFDAGEFVKVQGRAQVFNGRMQFAIESIRRVMTGADSQDRRDGFREDLLLASAPRPADQMWAELETLIAGIASVPLRQLLSELTSAHEAALRVWPAARAVHHAYRGGLLEHVLSMAEAGRLLARHYGADADLVVAGAVLHDIGKLEELDYQATSTTYTRDGNLVGHITLGAVMVDRACRAIPGFPDTLRSHLLHLIASHHGERELGSPVEPLSLEAFILSSVDDLDARVNQIRRAIDADVSPDEFTRYHVRLGRVLWKGDTG